MPSSLAAQLAQNASLNAAQLLHHSSARRRHDTASYLFTSREAGHHDLESIYALGLNGYTKVRLLQPDLEQVEDALFSETAKELDRTLLPPDQVKAIDLAIGQVLRLLSPHVLESPTASVIEYLVRRFRIHEFNVDDVLSCFLPYHESTQFAKMLSILHIKENTIWSFLLQFKSSGLSLPRPALVNAMVKDNDLTRFVSSLLQTSISSYCVHRALVGFHSGVFLEYIAQVKTVDEGVVAFLLPAFLQPLQNTNRDCVLSSLLLLVALCQKCKFAPAALEVILTAVLQARGGATTVQVLQSAVAICATQDDVDTLPRKVVGCIGNLADLEATFIKSFQWRGSEKFIRLVIPALIQKLDTPWRLSLLTEILSSPSCPVDIVEYSTTLLVDALATPTPRSSSNSVASSVQKVLSVVYQRHADIAQRVLGDRISAVGDKGKIKDKDKEVRGMLERFVLSLSLGIVTADGDMDMEEGDMVMAANSADAGTRAVGVRQILQSLAGEEDIDITEDPVFASMHDILLSRIYDPSETVIEALYSDPATLLRILKPAELVGAVAVAVKAGSVSRGVLKMHFDFVAQVLASGSTQISVSELGRLGENVFESVFVPFLLWTKPRKKTAALAWAAIEGAQSDLKGAFGLIKRCVELVNDLIKGNSESADGASDVSGMPTLNLALADKIAENIIVSDNFAQHSAYFLRHLKDENAHTRLLAHLVVRALLSRLTGEHQIDVACKLLEAIGLKNLDALSGVVGESESFQVALSDEVLGQAVVLKPNSRGTTYRLQASLLSLLPALQAPVNVELDWMTHVNPIHKDMRGVRFVQIVRKVYTLANSSSSLHVVSTNLLRALFLNLREQTLLFLAGIWSSPSSGADTGEGEGERGEEKEWEGVRLAALHHGLAFLQAQNAEKPRDFQVVLPSLLVALQSEDRRVRAAAILCVRALVAAVSTSQRPDIYGQDDVYGKASDKVQLLDWADFTKYAKAVDEHGDHFATDATYVGVFHQTALRKQKSDTKKEAAYKQRVLCYLVSHIVFWQSVSARVTLLKSIRHVSDPAKLVMLHPLIESLVGQDKEGRQLLRGVPESDSAEYFALLFETYDKSAIAHLGDASDHWATLLAALRCSIDPEAPGYLQSVPLQQLEKHLYPHLETNRMLEICSLLVDLATSTTNGTYYSRLKSTLDNLIVDTAVMVPLLTSLQPVVEGINERAKKRAKIDGSDEPSDASMQSLSIVLEIMAAKPLPGALELVACLLETLSRLCNLHASAKSEFDYLEQLCLTGLESAVDNIETTSFTPNALRVDVLVEVIRVTDNPQTFQHALLLIANMARLAPESILHNVMPVFTFMGSNVFHRDDSYSFKVVQKTVDSIVPVIVASFKEAHKSLHDLHIQSRDFLRIFTDASAHVPKHRRNKFFAHLIDVLGPKEFVSPICMLLVDKIANRVIRQKAADALASLSLPFAILQAHPPSLRITVLNEILQEVERLLAQLAAAEANEPAFLEALPDPHRSDLPSAIIKKQVLSLIFFVGHAWQQIADSPEYTPDTQGADTGLQDLVASLLRITTVKSQTDDINLGDVQNAAQKALSLGMSVIPVTDFTLAISSMLDIENSAINTAALDLLDERIPLISAKFRPSITPTILTMIQRICSIVSNSQDPLLVASSLKALNVITMTSVSAEEGALSEAAPTLLATVQRGIAASPALSVLSSLTSKLGPRLIAYLKPIINVCVDVIRAGGNIAEGLQVIQGLLRAVPSFWGTELLSVASCCLELVDSPSTDLHQSFQEVLDAIAERIPARLLLPSLVQLWDDLSSNTSSQTLGVLPPYFRLLGDALEHAARPDIMEHLKAIFRVFLEAFELRSKMRASAAAEAISDVENSCTSAFLQLVTKLNENTFKPLFRRLYDWAFATSDHKGTMVTLGAIKGTGAHTAHSDTQANPIARRMTFCHVMAQLVDMFKALITPYMAILLPSITEQLQEFSRKKSGNPDLWLGVISVLQKSIAVDEGVFWRDDRLEKIMHPVVQQIAIPNVWGAESGKELLTQCLTDIARAMTRDELLKALNRNILMQTRSEDPNVRLYTLACASHMWQEEGSRLIGFISDTITFIHECAEDENDEVAKEARKFKRVVEDIGGPLDGFT
ncbi:hypothetical protein BOTBODRAFT_144298 [Botryobasidium botryosum FD-172 SS1]|uniref:U3 small nucleolar RNA-associated protein 10 n=1 Tax=Botryobasidium botryosum (strain FD-172 SS1) TaxID=930990 RepID=A0A067MMG2_BOTB1|nr:hypothetical protein BOTBODRAFT_144298 [Botryobasidium botryosum FD-172 SS1]